MPSKSLGSLANKDCGRNQHIVVAGGVDLSAYSLSIHIGDTSVLGLHVTTVRRCAFRHILCIQGVCRCHTAICHPALAHIAIGKAIEVLQERRSQSSLEADSITPLSGITCTTDGTHVCEVFGRSRQVTEQCTIATCRTDIEGFCNCIGFARIDIRYHHLELRCTHLLPMHHSGGRGNAVDRELNELRAVACQLDGDIIDEDIVGRVVLQCLSSLEHDVVTIVAVGITLIVCEADTEDLFSGRIRCKRKSYNFSHPYITQVVRVTNNSHIEFRHIGSVRLCSCSREYNLIMVDAVVAKVNLRGNRIRTIVGSCRRYGAVQRQIRTKCRKRGQTTCDSIVGTCTHGTNTGGPAIERFCTGKGLQTEFFHCDCITTCLELNCIRPFTLILVAAIATQICIITGISL